MRNLIRQVRLLRGLTQAELAQKVGTTAATVSRLEKDTMTLSTEWLDRFAVALGVHPSELIEQRGRPAIQMLGKAGRNGRVSGMVDERITVEVPTNDAVAIEIAAHQGFYAAGERVIGERLRGASMSNGVGHDCIVALKDGAVMLARVTGTGPRFTLVPAEPRSTILYEQEVDWIAPLVIRMQIIA
ncbi:MAG: helix-turn-helix transcriptional regulator [Alphaproteobacteria bacterium]